MLNMRNRPKYYVSKVTGNKFPYGNIDNPCSFPIGTKLYINSEHSIGSLQPLPLSEYPFSIEYEYKND